MSDHKPYHLLVRHKGSNDVRKRDGRFSRAQVEVAMAAPNLIVFATKSPYPFVVLDDDTAWGKPRLARAINELGFRRGRYIRAGEFKRTSHRQWVLRMAYLRGQGNLAARCCSRYIDQHPWSKCGKDSMSNHADGNAADISVLHSGRHGAYTPVGEDKQCREIMRRLGMCLPVGQGETWHAEFGNVWLS